MDAGMRKRYIFIGLAAAILIIILVRTTGNIRKVLFKKPAAAAKMLMERNQANLVPEKLRDIEL